MKKNLIIFACMFTLATTAPCFAGETTNVSLVRKYASALSSLIKTGCRYAWSGIKNAPGYLCSVAGIKDLAAAYCIDKGIALFHELGHGLTGKLFYGNPLNINIGVPNSSDQEPVLKMPGLTIWSLEPLADAYHESKDQGRRVRENNRVVCNINQSSYYHLKNNPTLYEQLKKKHPAMCKDLEESSKYAAFRKYHPLKDALCNIAGPMSAILTAYGMYRYLSRCSNYFIAKFICGYWILENLFNLLPLDLDGIETDGEHLVINLKEYFYNHGSENERIQKYLNADSSGATRT